MTPKAVQRILRGYDPELTIAQSERTGKWVAQKARPVEVYRRKNPDAPSSGVHVLREIRWIPQTVFQLPYGLTQRSIDHACRMMFWRRGVSPDAVADALERDETLRDLSAKRGRMNYRRAFSEDYGRQIRKKLKGESTLNIPSTL